ncbi:MAG TPA: hypothetical protein VIH42_04480 [Thermoguttaceae bacterium]
MMSSSHNLSIWFFVGILLTIYGILVLGAGIYGIFSPPDVKLANLHAPIWWGALMLALGVVYLYHFAPERKKQ